MSVGGGSSQFGESAIRRFRRLSGWVRKGIEGHQQLHAFDGIAELRIAIAGKMVVNQIEADAEFR